MSMINKINNNKINQNIKSQDFIEMLFQKKLNYDNVYKLFSLYIIYNINIIQILKSYNLNGTSKYVI